MLPVVEVQVRLGDVIRIDAADRYRSTDGPTTSWVTGVRLVMNRPEQHEWAWPEGVRIAQNARSTDPAQILVRASLLAVHRLPPATGPARTS